MAQHESFLVRVWWRARPGEGHWVGRVEHLQQREIHNFHDPEALLAHLRTVIVPAESGAPESGPKSRPMLGGKGGSKEPAGDDLTAEAPTPKMGGKRGGLGASLGLNLR